ncbi:MAG TPA: DEAD/DEAH box helicase [Gemmataceae bacterium]|jgi:hypothetical protein|nr:DEAD/DEAH box helicase [Gemmataceae bacterium]
MNGATTKPTHRLTLKDRLSRLNFRNASKLLGPDGDTLLRRSANRFDIRIDRDVEFSADLFRVRVQDESPVEVTISLAADAVQKLKLHCSHDNGACAHIAAALSLILEDKTSLGLAVAPAPREPVESLDEPALVARALAERTERARTEKMAIESADPKRPWTEYVVTNRLTGKTYRVVLNGPESGDSECSCPDFRTNTLGTCKHILRVWAKLKRRFTDRALRRPAKVHGLSLHLRYTDEVTLQLRAPDSFDDAAARIISPLRNRPIEDIADLMKRLARLQALGVQVDVAADAEEYIQQRLAQDRLAELVAGIRNDPAQHPLRTALLKAPLLPYQLDGIAFAVGAGRAVLADDMGLGKTIQGVGIAELLAREAGIRKVLVVCPASLKSQWRTEIQRFCERTVQLVGGPSAERRQQYDNDRFFTVCNYEQVLRDILAIEPVKWDLIVLDEGQRIKNWEAKTSSVIKSLKSRFALVLTGTPLENRLDELYSVVQFVDGRRLGPGFRFFNKHRIIDEKGKVLGYKNLGDLRETLKPVLLRRTRDSVKLELPPRTTEIVRIPPSDEQVEIHRTHMQIVASITAKRYITEMDLLRLQKALLMCRMAADSTLLVTKEEPGYSTKLAYLDDLFERLFEEDGRKVIVFSEWTTMLGLIEKILRRRNLPFVRLDGSIPQKDRPPLVERFQTDPECKLFLSTNAGSTGLNLQSANTVINVDLPWNPAILEQRIARVHRMGQLQPVQVYVLVTELTIEENLLRTIAAKKDLALAALDVDSEVEKVDLVVGMDELKSRLEVLLGAKAEAPVDESKRQEVVTESTQRDRVASAGGELLGAAIKFLGQLTSSAVAPSEAVVANVRRGLDACVESGADGRPKLSFTLPDASALDGLTQALARLVAAASGA